MRREALLTGGLVLAMRIATLPRTPWDADELRLPFAVMVWVSVAASVVTAVALAMKFGGTASLLFSFSAAMLVHGSAARLEVLAWMFVALALVFCGAAAASAAERPPAAEAAAAPQVPWLMGALAGAAVACHPPLLVAMLALLFASRDLRALIPFAVVAAPFLRVPEALPVPHDWSLVRFTLHPWGSKFVALPVVACVAYGIWKKRPELDPLAWMALVHVVTGIALVDPADGVRWVVPSLIFVAVVAARAGWVAALIIAALSVGYTYPVLRDRVTRPSPPIEAVRALPRDVVILHDNEMAPFVGGLPLDEGMRRHLDDARPLLYVASANLRGARVFSRPHADAYGKLTRNAYRHVSLLPIAHRFAPIRGVYGLEHNEAGESWRWLDAEAELALPRGARIVTLELRSPYGPNEVWINGKKAVLGMNEIAATERLTIRARRTYALPAPDTRVAAVQLVRLAYR